MSQPSQPRRSSASPAVFSPQAYASTMAPMAGQAFYPAANPMMMNGVVRPHSVSMPNPTMAPNQLFGAQPALVSSQFPPMVQTAQQPMFSQAGQFQNAFQPPPVDEAHEKQVAELRQKLMEQESKTRQLQYEINVNSADPAAMKNEMQIEALTQELVLLCSKAETLEDQCKLHKVEVDKQAVQMPNKMKEQFGERLEELQKKHSGLEASVRKYEEERALCQKRLTALPDLEPERELMEKRLYELKEKCRTLEDSCLKFQAERVDVMEMQRSLDFLQREVFARQDAHRSLDQHRVNLQIENEKMRTVLRGRAFKEEYSYNIKGPAAGYGSGNYGNGRAPPGQGDWRGQGGLFYPPLKPITYEGPGFYPPGYNGP